MVPLTGLSIDKQLLPPTPRPSHQNNVDGPPAVATKVTDNMSPRQLDTSGKKGSRPGKGRFEPSEPLHMQTRHASRTVRPNQSPSTNGSVEDDESRRGSIEDVRPTTSQSLGSQTSAKGRRISGGSTNGTSDVNMSFESRISRGSHSDKHISNSQSSNAQNISPHESLSPSRKRKRSSSTSGGIPNGIPIGLARVIPTNEDLEDESFLDRDEDAVLVVPEELLSDRESDDSSDDMEADDYLAATQSTEATPMATPAGSEPASPVSDESQTTPVYHSKHVDVIMADVDQLGEDGDDADEGEDLIDEEDVGDADDVDDAEDEDGVPHAGPRRKFAGRRRAEHHVPEVEARMRRQLHLKSAYRLISRYLKPLLAEIAEKTTEELEAKPNFHEQVVEYEGTEEYDGIQKQLDDHLARRKAQLEAQHKHCKTQLTATLTGEKHVRKARCELHIEDLRDLQIDRLEHDMLAIARLEQQAHFDPSQDTEDEDDDVILRPKAMSYRFQRTGALDPKHDSRSRLQMESERASGELESRLKMREMIEKWEKQKQPDAAGGFTVMDSTARDAALAKREGVLNTSILADAAAEVERRANIPMITNEEAVGLQLLGDLASRPSIRATMPLPAPMTSHPLSQPLFGPQQPTQMPPPPPLRPPIQFDEPPPPQNEMLQLGQMSPRTERYVAERIHRQLAQMPSQRHVRVSGSRQNDHPVLSPASKASRGSMMPMSTIGAPESEFRVPSEALPTNHHRASSRDLQHRRASSRDSVELGLPAFERSGSSLPGASGRDDTAWEKYRRPLTADSDKGPPRNESVHEFSADMLRIARIAPQPDEERHPRPQTPPQVQKEPGFRHLSHLSPTPAAVSTPQRFLLNTPVLQTSPTVPTPSVHAVSPAPPPAPAAASHMAATDSAVEPITEPAVEPAEEPVAEAAIEPTLDSVAEPAIGPATIPIAGQAIESATGLAKEPAPVLTAESGREPVSAPAAQTSPAPTAPRMEASVADREFRYDPVKDGSAVPSAVALPAKPTPRWETPSSEGAADYRTREDPPPNEEPKPDMTLEVPAKKPRSRASSLGMSTATDVSESQDGSNAGTPTQLQSRKEHSKDHAIKHNRAQRSGMSRKAHRETRGKRMNHNTPMGEAGQMLRFRLNSNEPAKSTPVPSGPPTGTPHSVHAGFTPYAPLPSYNDQLPPPPPPPGYAHPYYGYDPNYYNHRNSFPGPGGAVPQPWPQGAPHSPTYGIPQGPPPPESWTPGSPAPIGPIAPPSGAGHRTPSNGSYGSQFGGPPIAPATPDARYPFGNGTSGGNHPPAFAQQQRNSESNSRKRAQSEIKPTKFHHYPGPKNKD